MRVLIVLCCLFLTTTAWCLTWDQGTVTRQIWLDQGGFHVEIDNISYLLMNEAKIKIDDIEHEIPDRMAWLTKKSRVRFSHEGFRIYALIVEWRN